MKRFTSLATLACAVSCGAFATAQELPPAPPAPILSLGGTQAEIDQPPLPPAAPTAGIPDPFVLSPEPSPSDAIQEAAELAPADAPLGGTATSDDPKSLDATSRRVRKPTVVDTMADYATLADIQHAGHAAVDWSYGMGHTPNHVAEAMLREYCVDGLWDGYSELRARECAEQWAHIHGLKQCRLFGQHGTCQQCGGTKNRYRHGHSCNACDR